ncbi:MAG: 50S ribosomal protein L6 [bacterium]
MSRIGKQVIPLPSGVSATVDGNTVRLKSSKGSVERVLPAGLEASVSNGALALRSDAAAGRQARATHGLMRSLLANSVEGLSKGFQRNLEIVGVGYRAELKGRDLVLALGYSHPIVFPLPEGVSAKVTDRPVKISLEGVDKAVIGQTVAKLRALRPPEPYKGKGVRNEGEVIKLKVGKTGLK